MNCERCQDLSIDHAHGELAPTLRAEVAAHLGECGACATAFCRLCADLQGIALAHAIAPRPEIRAALRRRVELELRPPWWRRAGRLLARPIPAYGALAAALAPVIAWAVDAARPEIDPPTAAPPAAIAPRVDHYDASHPPGRQEGVL
jgi:anti-sigma factor RsiW